MDKNLIFHRRILNMLDQGMTPEQVRQTFLQEYGAERPLLTEAQMTEMIRRYYPGYEPPAPATRQQREDLHRRAVNAYVEGSVKIFSPVPYGERLVSDKRSNQRLLSFMTSDEDRRLFAEALEKTQASYYANLKKPDGKAYAKEEIAALQRENMAKVDTYWLDNVSRLIDRYEGKLTKTYTDDQLVNAYSDLAIPIALTQEAVKAMNNYERASSAYTDEQREEFRKKITGMMEQCVTLEKRLNRMADTYYPVVNLESLSKAPLHQLDALEKNMTAESIGRSMGLMQEQDDAGDEDSEDAEQESPAFARLKRSLDNTLSVIGDAAFEQENVMGQSLADRYGSISMNALQKEYYFFDADGNVLKNTDVRTCLSSGGVMFTMRKDGSGSPEPVCAGAGQRTDRLVFGWDAVGAAQEPIPDMPVLSRSQKVGKWFSNTFARRPSAAQKEYERKLRLRQAVIDRNRRRRDAVSDGNWPKIEAAQKRVRLLQQRQTEGDRFLADTKELLSRASMTRDDPDTRLAVAGLAVSRLFRESMNADSYPMLSAMFGMEQADFSFARAAQKLADNPAFQTEFLDKEVLSNNYFVDSLRSGDPKKIEDAAGGILNPRIINFFGARQWDTQISSSYQAKLEQERVAALYERRQAEAVSFRNDTPELLQGLVFKPHDLRSRSMIAHLIVGSVFSEGVNGKNKALFAEMFGTDKEEFSFDRAAERLRNQAFGEFVDTKVLTDPAYMDAFTSGDPARVNAAAAKLCSGEFADFFRAKKWDTKASPAYEKQEKQYTNAMTTVMPGLLQDARMRQREEAYMGNELLWKNIESLYGGKRELRPDWTWLSGNHIYKIEQWREAQKNEIDVATLKPDGMAVDNRTFATLSMMLAHRPDFVASLQNFGATGTAVFEDVVASDSPRADTGRYLPEFVDANRRTVEQCLRSMDQPLPGIEPAVTGREKLAQELAQALKNFDTTVRDCTWNGRHHAALAAVAANTLHFAKEHGMTELLKQNGLTDSIMDNLEVGGAMAKVLTEALDAQQELVRDTEELHPENASKRGEWIHKMALGKAMQAEARRILAKEAKLDEPMPTLGKGESMESYNRRCNAYNDRQNAANNALHQFSEELRSLAHGGEGMEKLLDRLMPKEELEALQNKDGEEAYRLLSDPNGKLLDRWKKTLTEDAASDARARIFERQCRDFREMLGKLEDTPEHQAFISAANKVLASGNQKNCQVLMQLSEEKIDLIGSALQKDQALNLQNVLEGITNAAPDIAPLQEQKSDPVNVLE